MHVSEDVDYHLMVIGAAADELDSVEENKDYNIIKNQYENDEEVIMGEKEDRGYHDC
jgi:hypothetical protein